MAIYDKAVFHIVRLQQELVRLQNGARQQEHKDALRILVDDTSAMLEHARQILLATTANVNETFEPPPMFRNSWGFDALNVGEYITAESDIAATLRASASAYGKRHGLGFSVKKQKDGTVRCYRWK